MATLKVREVIKILKNHGFIEVSQTGSHCKFYNAATKHTVIVPVHGQNKDIPIGTCKHIQKQSGIDPQYWPF